MPPMLGWPMHMCDAFELRLRAPDALHLAIARRLDVSLVTLDRRMAAAAGELGIADGMPEASQTEREE